MDYTGITDEDYEYIIHWMIPEGNSALINHMNEEDINIRKHPVELMTYPIRCGALIVTNAKRRQT
jgi:hypothetical protein